MMRNRDVFAYVPDTGWIYFFNVTGKLEPRSCRHAKWFDRPPKLV
jgi:hypothetical protein